MKKPVKKTMTEVADYSMQHEFPRTKTGLIAVMVINHFGDEVMKVFRV